MVLQVLGLIAIVIFTFFVGKTARENGRNGRLWAAACVGAGIGFQVVAQLIVTALIVLVLVATGTPIDRVETKIGWWSFGLSALFIGLSVVAMFLILRHVARIAEDVSNKVPPPPTF